LPWFSGVVFDSIRAAALTLSEVIPPARAPNIAAISQPMFCPFEEWLTNHPSKLFALLEALELEANHKACHAPWSPREFPNGG
jgi:hypothetical protein